MALSPSVPTSFVPKQPVSGNPRRESGNNIFLVVSLVVFLVALLGCGGTYLYLKYLQGLEASKGQELVQKEKEIDPNTVEQFVRLQNRLVASEGIINQHIELSQFLDLLGNVTLRSVSFKSMQIQVADDRTATLTLTGTANNFNALAAESKAFASQPYIKSAIFSNIKPNQNNTVSFSVNASLDPRTIVEAAAPGKSTVPPPTTSAATLPSVSSSTLASTTP